VPHKPGCLIVNAGDQIDAYTNGHYRSAKHRVVTVSPKERYSTAFFTYFNYRAKLEPLARYVHPGRELRWPPMDTREWFQYKLRQSVGEKVSDPKLRQSVQDKSSDPTSKSADPTSKASDPTSKASDPTSKASDPTSKSSDPTEGVDQAAATNASAASCGAPTPDGGAVDGAVDDAVGSAVVRPISGAVLGVEAVGFDLLSASDAQVDMLIEALHGRGRGLLVVRNQTLSPEGFEAATIRLGQARSGFGTPMPYERWAGQSPRLRCCRRVSLLGNYRARVDDELGTGARLGSGIGEYKPAVEELREWHTDGSFLLRPKVGIALYTPSLEPVETCTPCDEPAAWWRTILHKILHKVLRVPCVPICRPAPAGGTLPPEGGETTFASGLRGYDMLSAAERTRYEGLSAIHSWCDFMRFLEARDPNREKVTDADCAAKPDVTWPLIRTHPVTGKHSLYLNPKNALRVVETAKSGVKSGVTTSTCARWVVEPICSASRAAKTAC